MRLSPDHLARSCALAGALTACPADQATTSATDPTTGTTDPSTADPSTSTSETSSSTAETPTTSTDATTAEPTSTGVVETDTADASSTGEPGPAVCGDGIVQASEACDDGNDESGDSCLFCHRRPKTDWTVALDGRQRSAATGVTVAPTGEIVVVGEEDAGDLYAPFVLVLAPDGAQVWKKLIPSALDARYAAVAVDPDGFIYAAGTIDVAGADPDIAILHKFDLAGEPVWTYEELAPGGFDATFTGVTVGDGGVFTVGHEGQSLADTSLVVRRFDPQTGAPMWAGKPVLGEQNSAGWDLAFTGGQVVAVGSTRPAQTIVHPLIIGFDLLGAETFLVVEGDESSAGWEAVAAIGDGEFVAAGWYRADNDLLEERLARFGPDGATLWTSGFPFQSELFHAVAAHPTLGIATAGRLDHPLDDEFANELYTGDGKRLWGSFESPSQPPHLGIGYGVAFGADFFVVVGAEIEANHDRHTYVRRYGFE